MSTADHPQADPIDAVREIPLRYVLVADADVRRTNACLESIRPFNVGALIAGDGDQAAGILQRFGPPILLAIDLSLPGRNAVEIIELVRSLDDGRAGIIGWASSRDIREFAAHRLRGLNVRILGSESSAAVLRGIIDRLLRPGTPPYLGG